MTFTIVALSRDGMQLAVATSTCTLAVGSAVPAAAPGVGAIATQAYTNRLFRSRTLDLLRTERTPEEVIATLREEDPGFSRRQIGIVDLHGRSAVHTGEDCTGWAGAVAGPRHAILGNLLTGPQVVEAMSARLLDHHQGDDDAPFAQHMVDALRAGQDAGGDRRGRQSAALFIVSNADVDTWPPETVVDLRVDDHREPVAELDRLLQLHHREALGVPGAAVGL